MQAIEFETTIDEKGYIYLPESFQHFYGKFAKLVVLLPEQSEMTLKKKRKPGSAKGILKIIKEDETHLDDFKEYMS